MTEVGMVSGERQRGFREGWAVKSSPGGTSGKAHYFRREGAGLCISVCQGHAAPAGALFAPGSFVKCNECQSYVDGEARKAAREAVDARGAPFRGDDGSEGPKPA